VLSGTYKKLLSAQVLAEAPPSLLFEVDLIFQSSYAYGLAVTGTIEAGQFICSKRQNRFWAPRKISALQSLCGHEKAANQAA
jgi:hypothetical protein